VVLLIGRSRLSRGRESLRERLPSLKSPKCPTHLAWPVSLCVAMEDNKSGCKKEKRRDAADVREKATPIRDPPFDRPALGLSGLHLPVLQKNLK